MRTKATQLIVLTVPIIRNGAWHAGAPTSQLSYVATALQHAGFEVLVHDGFQSGEILKRPHLRADASAAYLYLARTEGIEPDSLNLISEQISHLHDEFLNHEARVYAFGPLAAAILELLPYSARFRPALLREEDGVNKGSQIELANSTVANLGLAFSFVYQTFPEGGTIRSSFGCNKHCSFCAYNLDHGAWAERPIDDVIREVVFRYRNHGIRRFSFSDANFAPSIVHLIAKMNDMMNHLAHHELLGKVRFSVNVTHDCFNHEVIRLMADVGIDRCLIGLEALSPETCVGIYHKKTAPSDFSGTVTFAKSQGVIPVLSLILFHPWLTLNQLKDEYQLIEGFGRAHFIHFMANSFVRLVSGTSLHNRASHEKLLSEGGTPNFRFKDVSVAAVFDKLHRRMVTTFTADLDTRGRARLKMDEWHYLGGLLSEGVRDV